MFVVSLIVDRVWRVESCAVCITRHWGNGMESENRAGHVVSHKMDLANVICNMSEIYGSINIIKQNKIMEHALFTSILLWKWADFFGVHYP